MVGLHVVDDDVIQLAQVGHVGDLGQELIGLQPLRQVNQRLLLAVDQIRVVGDAFLGDGPVPLKEVGRPVVDADPENAGSDFYSGHG